MANVQPEAVRRAVKGKQEEKIPIEGRAEKDFNPAGMSSRVVHIIAARAVFKAGRKEIRKAVHTGRVARDPLEMGRMKKALDTIAEYSEERLRKDKGGCQAKGLRKDRAECPAEDLRKDRVECPAEDPRKGKAGCQAGCRTKDGGGCRAEGIGMEAGVVFR